MMFLSFVFLSLLALSVSARECSHSQFGHYSPPTGDACLPLGGSPNSPSPPRDKDCPWSWQWHRGFGCCVPTHPHPSPPVCRSGRWDHNYQWCYIPTPPSPPTPSGGVHHHPHKRAESKVASRNWRSKTISCGAGQTVCNVSDGLSATTWACVNTQKDVSFCGGCSTNGDSGQDCTAIPNAWNVGCESGKCQVFTCESGFRVSRDGKTCVSMD